MKTKAFLCIIIALMLCFVIAGCSDAANGTPEPTAKSAEEVGSEAEAPSSTAQPQNLDDLKGYDFNDASVKSISFGECFAGVFTCGYKFDFATNKLLFSEYYEDMPVEETDIDAPAAEEFQEALKDMELYRWYDSYYDIDDAEEDLCYDGGWMIEVEYDNGYKKTITGFGVIPEKGDDFKKAVYDLCGMKWTWGNEEWSNGQ